jgi:8-amino-7-oxononanoate synthase
VKRLGEGEPRGPLDFLVDRIGGLEREGLLRSRPDPVPDPAATFCSNDYLGLAGGLRPQAATAAGASASRLIVGGHAEHDSLERALAEWLEVPATLLFSSGYAANLGTISSLAEAGDLIVSDELNHASIIDGCRLSRAQVAVIPHLSLEAADGALRRHPSGRRWVVTESYFSMDADTPDLSALRRLCDDRGAALVVDEAHAMGVFGPGGRGLCREKGVEADVLVGTLGKAFGAAGAFVAGSQALVTWLWNRARSFVFSTGMSPLVAQAARLALGAVQDDPSLRQRLHSNAELLRAGLRALGLAPLGYGPIVPLVVGRSVDALAVATELRRGGVHVQAVRPPTVPDGTARLRLTTTARHTPAQIHEALRVLQTTLPWPARSS